MVFGTASPRSNYISNWTCLSLLNIDLNQYLNIKSHLFIGTIFIWNNFLEVPRIIDKILISGHFAHDYQSQSPDSFVFPSDDFFTCSKTWCHQPKIKFAFRFQSIIFSQIWIVTNFSGKAGSERPKVSKSGNTCHKCKVQAKVFDLTV